jgi:hypothetical protein
VRRFFTVAPCLLCGQVHALKIRSLLARKVRSPEKETNTLITIIMIICPTAKERGRQYTKRLLPPFVIPYCVICREPVLAYLRLYPEGILHTVIASRMMGTVDLPTIRRHLKRARQLIKDAARRRGERLRTPYVSPPLAGEGMEESAHGPLQMAGQESEHPADPRQADGGGALPVLVYVHALDMDARARDPLISVTTLVLRAAGFHDSS